MAESGRRTAKTTWRARLHDQLDPTARPHRLSPVNRLLVVLILAATFLAILETEEALFLRHEALFHTLELTFGVLFLAEYLGRVWTAPERPGDRPAWRKRLDFVVSFEGLMDLAAVVTAFLPYLFAESAAARALRLVRVIRLAKLGRYSETLRYLRDAIRSRGEELLLSLCVGLVLMLVASIALYFVEGQIQPDKFGSVPRALWWAVATMTTIGYGDVYPITALGRFIAAILAVLSIGLIAMPAGILAAAFSDAVIRGRTDDEIAAEVQAALDAKKDE